MITKKTITFTIDQKIVDELKGIAKDEQLNMSAIAQKLFLEWLVVRNNHGMYGNPDKIRGEK